MSLPRSPFPSAESRARAARRKAETARIKRGLARRDNWTLEQIAEEDARLAEEVAARVSAIQGHAA